jgi:hypothetical protein
VSEDRARVIHRTADRERGRSSRRDTVIAIGPTAEEKRGKEGLSK